MKKKFLLLSLFAAALSFTSCSEDESLFMNPSHEVIPEEPTRSLFPEDDGSKLLSSSTSPNQNVRLLLEGLSADYIKEMTDTLGRANITDEQYAEIQAFAQELTAGLTTDKDKYNTCFNWVVNNIRYDYADNDPYPVFKNKVGICQGYANLLFIMLHSLDVPAFVCNGQVNVPPYGGHAWNYVYDGTRWWVSDPTNNGNFLMRSPAGYSHLLPSSLDVVLAKKGGVWFNYNEFNFNICKIESNEEVFVVPFSANGYRVTSLNPSMEISPNIKEMYIGKNITTLGENYMGLTSNAPNLEYVYVDPENTVFESYLGAVYRKNGSESQLTYIPGGMKCLELKPMETIYKNTVFEHKSVEVAIVAPGTKKIEAWGFEQCPNLKIAYVPEDTEIADNAFTAVHPDFQIVRGDYTNIPEIRE